MNWSIVQGDWIDVLPNNDLKPHLPGASCRCRPRIEEAGRLVIHNAWDGREFFEGEINEYRI